MSDSSNPTFYARASTRNAARDRLVSGFPLPEVNMTAPVGPEDFTPKKTWPPTRVAARADRLHLYEDMWRGDITRFVKDKTAANLVMNYFERVPTVIAALLLSKDPQVPLDQMVPVQRMLAEASVNGLRSGRAYIIDINGEVSSPATSQVFDGPDGEIYVLTEVSTVEDANDTPTQLRLQVITEDGGTLDVPLRVEHEQHRRPHPRPRGGHRRMAGHRPATPLRRLGPLPVRQPRPAPRRPRPALERQRAGHREEPAPPHTHAASASRLLSVRVRGQPRRLRRPRRGGPSGLLSGLHPGA